jgi:hypothetical protein
MGTDSMKHLLSVAALFAALGAAPVIRGEGPTNVVPCQQPEPCGRKCAPIAGCPDDYCPKPWPCTPCLRYGECDDYHPKPFPCIGRLCCGEHDDYCRKPCPANLCPPWFQHYVCVPLKSGWANKPELPCATTPTSVPVPKQAWPQGPIPATVDVMVPATPYYPPYGGTGKPR